jgi:adenylate kinase
MSLRVALFGPPTAGKSTISWTAAERLGLRQIALGQLLRTAGGALRAELDRGALLSDDAVMAIVAGAIADASEGFILDGFPRTPVQLAWLEAAPAAAGCRFLFLHLDRERIRERFLARASCLRCRRADYGGGAHCTRCGGELVDRGDATEEALRRKLEDYDAHEWPLVQRLAEEGRIERLEMSGDADADAERLIALIAQKEPLYALR